MNFRDMVTERFKRALVNYFDGDEDKVQDLFYRVSMGRFDDIVDGLMDRIDCEINLAASEFEYDLDLFDCEDDK